MSAPTKHLHLIRAPTIAAEAALADRHLEASCGGRCIPVLADDGLRASLEQALRLATFEPVWHDDNLLECHSILPVAPSPTLPTLLFAVEGVHRGAFELAATLCGSECHVFTGSLPELSEQGKSSALLLYTPQDRPEVAWAAANRLAEEHVNFGMLPVVGDPVQDRFVILKALLVSELPPLKLWKFLAYPHLWGTGLQLPKEVPMERGLTLNTWSDLDTELLVISGHGTGVDLSLGPDLTICALKGLKSRAAVEEAFYPCAADGQCSRQVAIGRSPNDHSTLVAIDAASYIILVLASCYAVDLGEGWHSWYAGLHRQAIYSSALGIIGATGIINMGDMGRILPLIHDLIAGRTIGEVVTRENRRRITLGGEVPIVGSAGPFVAFGNPNLRFAPSSDETRVGAFRSGPVEQHAGARLFTEPETELWVRGAVDVTEGGESTVMLLVGDEKCEMPLKTRSVAQIGEVRAAVIATARQMPLWAVLAESWRQKFAGHDADLSRINRLLEITGESTAGLWKAASALRDDTSVVACGPANPAVAAAESIRQLSVLYRELSEISLRAARLGGSLFFSSWMAALELDPTSVAKLRGCCCGTPGLAERRYRWPSQQQPVRSRFECLRCGPAGEDDGRGLLTVAWHADAQLRTLQAEVVIDSPVDETILSVLIAIVEDPRQHFAVQSEWWIGLTAAGTRRIVQLDLEIPNGFVTGVYPTTVLGVVNGALHSVSHMRSF